VESRATIAAGTKITEAESRELDQLAETYGLSRAGVLRELLNEAVKARREGRALFEVPAAPLTAEQVLLLVQQTQTLCRELDRQHDEQARREQRLNDAYRASEAAGAASLQSLSREIRSRLAEGETPYLAAVASVREDLASCPDQLHARLRPDLLAIAEKLEAVMGQAEQPRTTNQFVVPGGSAFATKLVAGWLGMAVAAGLLLGLVGPTLWRGTAVFAASRGLSSPDRICRLIERKYGVDDCTVPEPERDLGLRVLAHEAGR